MVLQGRPRARPERAAARPAEHEDAAHVAATGRTRPSRLRNYVRRISFGEGVRASGDRPAWVESARRPARGALHRCDEARRCGPEPRRTRRSKNRGERCPCSHVRSRAAGADPARLRHEPCAPLARSGRHSRPALPAAEGLGIAPKRRRLVASRSRAETTPILKPLSGRQAREQEPSRLRSSRPARTRQNRSRAATSSSLRRLRSAAEARLHGAWTQRAKDPERGRLRLTRLQVID